MCSRSSPLPGPVLAPLLDRPCCAPCFGSGATSRVLWPQHGLLLSQLHAENILDQVLRKGRGGSQQLAVSGGHGGGQDTGQNAPGHDSGHNAVAGQQIPLFWWRWPPLWWFPWQPLSQRPVWSRLLRSMTNKETTAGSPRSGGGSLLSFIGCSESEGRPQQHHNRGTSSGCLPPPRRASPHQEREHWPH